jgi:hypothetical protein
LSIFRERRATSNFVMPIWCKTIITWNWDSAVDGRVLIFRRTLRNGSEDKEDCGVGKLIGLVFAVGFMGLGGMALLFFLRFLLLTWLVQVVGNAVQSVSRLIKTIIYTLIFVFGPAVLGAFIIGLGLQFIVVLYANGSNSSADPTMPILLAFLAFFIIIAVRAWQWSARRVRKPTAEQERGTLGGHPSGSGMLVDAWAKAIQLAPGARADILDAQSACAALLTAVEMKDGLHDDSMIETALLIRDYLAALIDSTERRLHDAQPAEKVTIIAEMVRFLLGFGQRARHVLQAVVPSVVEDDAALRAHLATQLFR